MSEQNSFTSFSLYDEKPTEGALVVKVYINDKELDVKFGLISIWIRKEVNKIGKADINLKAWSEIEADGDPDSDTAEFTPGNSIKIKAGYLNTTQEQDIFEGIVISQQIEVDDQSDASLKIECRDYMYPATMVTNTTIHKDTSDKKLLQALAGSYKPVSTVIGNANDKSQDISQYNMADWDLILQRAKLNSFCVITEGKKTTIDKPVLQGSPAYEFRFRDNIISIKGKMQASKQLSKVQVLAWNSKEQKLMSVNVDKTEQTDQGDLSHSDLAKKMGSNELTLQTSEYTDDSSIKKWAEAKLMENSLRRIQGDVTCKGTALIKTGCIVKVVDVGKHFDGNAFCGAVEHDIKDGNWLTTACMGYADDAEAQANQKNENASSGNVQAIKGLHIGKVIQIDEDPTKEYNILIELPLFKSDQPNKVWARFSTFWASNKYGAFFLPDIDDEVVVGFFDNDANKPVIMGSLYSSKQGPANIPNKKNNIRSIVTKSNMKLEFEEEKKCITIETPGKNTIEISDDGKSIKLTDQNKNKIEMTESGISIQSSKSITLKAETSISIEAGANVDIKGKSDVNLKAANIEAKADIAFTGKGSAKAELSAGGQTIIKGAMVMIN